MNPRLEVAVLRIFDIGHVDYSHSRIPRRRIAGRKRLRKRLV
jgi:hypothetical protein